ncbi:hypothetical protein NPIL_650331 [Nephila pilipes]|uniref:Uncharacterized protein n=1 Tax=Nephila pilipes TaxID=299642 RepID=A0A8X6R054_NEPPI|nr:hypothetical protein NPIL_650331 [Nephila pilipes]
MRDLNAKVGRELNNEGNAIGNETLGEETNENFFVGLWELHNLIIGDSIFKYKDIHKITGISPERRTKIHCDDIAIRNMFRRSLCDVRIERGADVASDHLHLMTIQKLKLMQKL